MILREIDTGKYAGIMCDVEGCKTMAPDAREIMAGHGLNNMGWQCWGGTHLCPEHADPYDAERREQERMTIQRMGNQTRHA